MKRLLKRKKKRFRMDMTTYVFRTMFARDMLMKMHYGSSFDIVRFKKVTVQYTSKYMLAEPKNILLPCVALQLVTGQTPHVRRAAQSVAAFKLKKSQVLGCAVTLRKEKMYRFMTQCVHVLLPQFKDYASLPVSALQPNVHFGVEQLLFFPALEKHVDIFEPLEGCSVHVHTTAKTQAETLLLCSGLKLPTHAGDKDIA
jgi:large subunit ribosomal protein L5